MALRTTMVQRQEFYHLHQHEQTYRQIAARYHVSPECVRYWCRRQRDGGGCQTLSKRITLGVLSRFHPYLHQWACFRRPPKLKSTIVRLHSPCAAHQQWQVDFKVGIALSNRTLVNLHTVRDPVGEACIGAQVFAAGSVGHRPQRVTVEQTRMVLRTWFAAWHTVPDEIQTDGEPALYTPRADGFPSRFTLWLKGLGIDHVCIRGACPTDNAAVERCHRTVNEYAVVGNETNPVESLQPLVTQAVHELNFELPSRAEGCHGQPPIVAHPELLHPRHRFDPANELIAFDLKRVDAYLATLTWTRRVEVNGQVSLGGSHDCYSIGRCHARKTVFIKFDPTDRHFVFYAEAQPEVELVRRPARRLAVADLTGLGQWPTGTGWQQLGLPFEG